VVHEDRHSDKHSQTGEDPLKPEAMPGYYLVDDWGDNLLSGRDLRFKAADYRYRIACRFRPEWTIVSGTAYASDGILVMPASTTDTRISTPSNFTIGKWELSYRHPTTAITWCYFLFMRKDVDNKWRIHTGRNAAGVPSAYVLKVEGGIAYEVLSYSWANDQAWHTWKITRDTAGNFMVFDDGQLKGTFTDPFTPIGEVEIRGDYRAEVNFRDLRLFNADVS